MKTKPIECNFFEVLKNIHKNAIILPLIQRDFVWIKCQTIALFNSIMLSYSISTFLFWNIEGFNFSREDERNEYNYLCYEE